MHLIILIVQLILCYLVKNYYKHNFDKPMQKNDLLKKFINTRKKSISICNNLEIEDYVVQPSEEVSPIKWHLGHTSWFFEEMILLKYIKNLTRYDEQYKSIFNSYYKSAGDHWKQGLRGQLSRPTVSDVLKYRKYINLKIITLLESTDDIELNFLIELGINHEEQHQELMYMDIKYIFNTGPDKIKYINKKLPITKMTLREWEPFEEGIYSIGNEKKQFSYDNEQPAHKVYIQPFKIQKQFVSNKEYIKFIEDKGYNKPNLWLSKGWEWINKKNIVNPQYWYKTDNKWFEFSLHGLLPINENAPVAHISYYEAAAYAKWKKCRLPTEEESEIYIKKYEAITKKRNKNIYHPYEVNIITNNLWWWTKSNYSAYPGYKPFNGDIEEYNEKFMYGQFILKGGSIVTPEQHHRYTYRNFYEPHQRWMFSGIRLAKD